MIDFHWLISPGLSRIRKMLCLIPQHFLKRGFVELSHPRPNAAFLDIFWGYKANVGKKTTLLVLT